MLRSLLAVLGFLLISVPTTGSAALSVDIDASRGTSSAEDAPAPLAVTFRTDISDADFLTWHCEWDFGDDDSAEWGTSPHPAGSLLRKKNRAIGGVASHVYESPGTFTATLTCSDGTSVGSDAVTIIVDDPDEVYAGSRTICVSPAGQFNFPECSGAQQDTRSDLTAVLNTHMQPGNRVLLHRGETFSMSGSVTRASGSNGMVGAYGTGAKPRVDGPSAMAAFPIEGIRDWTFADFDFRGRGSDRYFVCAQGGCPGCTDGHCGDPMQNVLFHDIDVSGVSTAYLYAHSGLSELDGIPAHKNLFIVEGSIEASGVSYNRNAVFGGHNGGGIMGVDVQANTVHNIRIMCQLNTVFQHNNVGGISSAGDDFRHCSYPGDTRSKRILISDNTWASGGVSVKPNGTSSTVGARARYGIFERNLQFNTLQLKHLEHWVVRDNVCNRGRDSCWQLFRGSNNPQTLQNVHIYNNSQQSTNSSGYGVVWYSEIGDCLSNSCSARNNLVYSTGASVGRGGTVVQVGGVTTSNNINTPDSSPFIVSDPRTIMDFRLKSTSSARDAGVNVGRLSVDIHGNCRDTPDVGAWESEGPMPQCLGGTPPPPPPPAAPSPPQLLQ